MRILLYIFTGTFAVAGSFLHVEVCLETHPECLGGAKIAGQAQCRIGSNRPFAVNNFIDPAGRDADFPGDAVLAQPHGHQELVQENLTGTRIVRAYVQEDEQHRRFEELNREYRARNMALVLAGSTIPMATKDPRTLSGRCL